MPGHGAPAGRLGRVRTLRAPVLRDAAVALTLVVVMGAVSVRWDVFHAIAAWSVDHPWIPVDDVVVLLAAAHLVVLVFGARRARDLRQEMSRNSHDALHDALTGLPNRVLFFDRLQQGLACGRRHGTVSAVLLIDLNGFKEVNDSLGHHAGDVLLQQVARRLLESARRTDTVARLGGDEFAVLLTDLPDLAAAQRAGARFTATFAETFMVPGTQLRVTPSVGLALQGCDGDEPEELLRKADAAMYAAKRVGGGIAHYDAARDDAAARLVALAELRTGIAQGQLRLHYQPSVRLRDGFVTGAEALVRGQHPDRGLLPPDQFIPLAEHSELIAPLTAWVIEEAVGQCRRWLDEGLDLCVAVNLSARSVVDDHLPSLVRSTLRRHGLPAYRLVFEITETSLISRPDDASRVLNELFASGVNLAVDDFGTGYATLAWLQRLPFNALKIDRTFVADVTSGGPGAELVRYTTQLAHAMSKVVVAEGVESAEQWTALERMGCDHAQGYGIGLPLPAEEFCTWLQEWESNLPHGIGVVPAGQVLEGVDALERRLAPAPRAARTR